MVRDYRKGDAIGTLRQRKCNICSKWVNCKTVSVRLHKRVCPNTNIIVDSDIMRCKIDINSTSGRSNTMVKSEYKQ